MALTERQMVQLGFGGHSSCEPLDLPEKAADLLAQVFPLLLPHLGAGPLMNRTFPVDLQTHTTFSDGRDTPEELVSKAAASGIRVLAVTDHDSVQGVAAARAAGAKAGVHVLPAIELSTAKEEDRE